MQFSFLTFTIYHYHFIIQNIPYKKMNIIKKLRKS